jgi:hypothetical protein
MWTSESSSVLKAWVCEIPSCTDRRGDVCSVAHTNLGTEAVQEHARPIYACEGTEEHHTKALQAPGRNPIALLLEGFRARQGYTNQVLRRHEELDEAESEEMRTP